MTGFEWRRFDYPPDVEEPPPPPPPTLTGAQHVLTLPGLLAFYRLAEADGATVMADSSGLARHGSYGGTVDLGRPSLTHDNDPSTAAQFGGAAGATAGRGRVEVAPWLQPTKITVHALWRPASIAGTVELIGRGSSTAAFSSAMSWRLLRANAVPTVRVFAGGGSASGVASGGAVVAGEEYRVCFTFEGSIIRLYLNGVEVGNVTRAGNLNAGTFPMIVGTSATSSSTTYGTPSNAELQDVALWDRALTAAEVAELNTRYTTPPPPPPDPAPEPERVWLVDEDRTAGLMGWNVTGYGRADSTARTTPTQVTVTLAAELAGDCPVVGERFQCATTDPDAVRFTGEVTDATHDPTGRRYTVTGVGRFGRASRRPVDPRWPAELDGARAARILKHAGVEAGDVDPGTVTVLAAHNAATVAQLADQLADSAGAVFLEQLDGTVDYQDADHRRNAPVVLTLDAGELLNDLQWSQHVGDVLNELEVTYGDPPARVKVRDPGSIDERDPFPGTLNTILTTASDAHSLGSLIVARRREPVWQLPALVLDLRRTVTAAKRTALMALRFGDRIKVTNMPAGGPYAGDVEFFVEGLAESLAGRKATADGEQRHDWRLAIAVSDPILSGVALRWKDAPADLTWSGVDPALTWLDAALLTDPADLGA